RHSAGPSGLAAQSRPVHLRSQMTSDRKKPGMSFWATVVVADTKSRLSGTAIHRAILALAGTRSISHAATTLIYVASRHSAARASWHSVQRSQRSSASRLRSRRQSDTARSTPSAGQHTARQKTDRCRQPVWLQGLARLKKAAALFRLAL